MSLLMVAIAVGIFVGVVALTALQLRGRRWRWPLVALAAVLYLVAGNIVSRVLVGAIYPANPAGMHTGTLTVLQMIHSLVSLGVGAGLTILLVAGLRRVVPRAETAAA